MSDNNPEPKLSVEETLSQLQNLIEKMEGDDMPLEDSLAAFERGIELTRQAQKALTEAEQKVKVLLERDGAPQLGDFDTAEDE